MSRECYMDTVLAWIKHNPRCRTRQIAEGTGLRVHQVSNAVRSLVKKGVVLCDQRNGVCAYQAGSHVEFGKSRTLNEFNNLISCVRQASGIQSS